MNTQTARKERIVRVSAALLVSVALGWATAQTTAQPVARTLSSPKVVGGVLYTSTQELLLVVPSIRSKEIADGLRRAAVERGTPVFVLAEASLVEERAGYLPGLSLVKNIQVRLLRGLSDSSAVVDRKLLILGPLVFDIPNPLESQQTQARTDPRAVTNAVNWFAGAWKNAKPYTYRPATRKP